MTNAAEDWRNGLARTPATHPELRRSGARIAADRLRVHILQTPDGAYLGSEDELIQRLGVGRHTLRQAARLLEDQLMLKVRRGVGGGYYGARPNADMVVDAAATYLRSRGGSIADLFATTTVLYTELARLAALSDDTEARAWLADLRDRMARAPFREDREVEEIDFELRDCIYALAANPYFEFTMRVLVRFAFQEQHFPLVDQIERRRAYQKGQLKVVEAILDRDPDLAALSSRRFGRVIEGWVALRLSETGKAQAATAGATAQTPDPDKARSAP